MKKYFLLFIFLGLNTCLFTQDWNTIFKQLYIPSPKVVDLALPTENMYIPTWQQWKNGQRMFSRCYTYRMNGELVVWDQGKASIQFTKNGTIVRLIRCSDLKSYSVFFQKSNDFYGIGFDEREEKIFLYFGKVGILVYDAYSLELLNTIEHSSLFFSDRYIVNNGIINYVSRDGKLKFLDFSKNQETILDLNSLNTVSRLQGYLDIDSISASLLLASSVAPYFVYDRMINGLLGDQVGVEKSLLECVNILYPENVSHNNMIFENIYISGYLGCDGNMNYYYLGEIKNQLNKTTYSLFIFNKKLKLINILDIDYVQYRWYVMPNGDIKQFRAEKNTEYQSTTEFVHNLFETTIKNTWDSISEKQVNQYLAKMGLANTN